MRKNKKVGIITFHDVYSYGANLQCLGLVLCLKEMGFEPYVIDYSLNAFLEMRSKHKFKTILTHFRKLATDPVRFVRIRINEKEIRNAALPYIEVINERNEKFRRFQKKYYPLTPNRYEYYSELHNNCPDFSAFICGSDQIWNPSFCDMDDNYYLSFAPPNKRIAYAPSFGTDKITGQAANIIRKRLNAIKHISVREKSGQIIINRLIDKEVPVVIDPTFLVSKEEWKTIAQSSSFNAPSKYILTYFIGIDEYTKRYIQCIRENFPEYEIINLVFDQTKYGPDEFLALIINASFVFTNSFHGAAFCINLNKPFAVGKSLKDFGAGSAFGRIENLLKIFHLEDRIVNSDCKLDETWLHLSFDEINEKRDCLVSSAKDYLSESLNDVIFGCNN